MAAAAVRKQNTALRLTTELLARSDALVSRIEASPAGQWGRITRSAILRMALVEGLAILETRYPEIAAPPAESSTPEADAGADGGG